MFGVILGRKQCTSQVHMVTWHEESTLSM